MQDVRVVHREMLGPLADDEDQLAFVVERLGAPSGERSAARARTSRGRAAQEDGREFRNVVAVRAFLDVLKIVEAKADDLLPGLRDRQRVLQTLQRLAG